MSYQHNFLNVAAAGTDRDYERTLSQGVVWVHFNFSEKVTLTALQLKRPTSPKTFAVMLLKLTRIT